jgi:hypothetical protein
MPGSDAIPVSDTRSDTTAAPEYTREEMREACQNNYNAGKAAKLVARPLDEWDEDMGDVLWFMFPIEKAPWVGTPLDLKWPGHHTHWTPLPPMPEGPDNAE